MRRHAYAWAPALLLAAAAVLSASTGFDLWLANAWAWDPGTGWLGRGRWWAEVLLHERGRDAVRAIALGCLVFALAGGRVPRLARWRSRAAYVALAIVATTALVGLLKQLTNVDCPWDLAGFGGTRPYVGLFGDRPDGLPRAACLPGAHASSGFALLACGFALRGVSRNAARFATAVAVAVGAAFSFAQQARGAHFLSHDLWSAAIAWLICAGLWRLALRRGMPPRVERAPVTRG